MSDGPYRSNYTKVIAWRCTSCGDLVFSRTRHDLRFCSCKKTGVDGGLDERDLRLLGDGHKRVEMYIEQTKEELYQDWSSGRNEYGLIRPH
jgi:hypothetical protein